MITQHIPRTSARIALAAVGLAAVLWFLIALFVPDAASAQTSDPGRSIVDQLELQMLALSPLVALVSSLLLKPDAAKSVQKAVPAVVGVIGSLVYFLLGSFPDAGSAIVANIVLVVAAGSKWYDPLDGLAQVAFGSKLNKITGSGIVGSSTVIEGD